MKCLRRGGDALYSCIVIYHADISAIYVDINLKGKRAEDGVTKTSRKGDETLLLGNKYDIGTS